MSRLQKKCLMASTGMHGLLVLILVVGSAFIASKEKPLERRALVRVVPLKMIDGETSGGGNPDIPVTADIKRGTPNPSVADVPKPPIPTPTPKPPLPAPPVAPTPIVKPPEPRVQKKPEAKKPVVKPVVTPPKTPPAPEAKRTALPTTKPAFDPLKELTPVKISAADKAAADARAREQAEAAERAAEHAATGRLIARQLAQAKQGLAAGFQSGTKVDVHGPGGEAFADYGDYVKAIYDDAWGNPDSLMDDNSTARVVVSIARNGQVLSARIERKSGNVGLDRSVQRALDRVKYIGKAFPPESKDEQRIFHINFNLKSKTSAG